MINSRTHKVSSDCDRVVWYHRNIKQLIAVKNCKYHQRIRMVYLKLTVRNKLAYQVLIGLNF